MTRRMNLVTINYVLRIAALLLAVVLNLLLISDAVRGHQPIEYKKVFWLATGAAISTLIAGFMMLNPPD